MEAASLRRLEEANERLAIDMQHDAGLIDQLRTENALLHAEFEHAQSVLAETQTELTRLANARQAEQTKLYYTVLLQDEIELRHRVCSSFFDMHRYVSRRRLTSARHWWIA